MLAPTIRIDAAGAVNAELSMASPGAPPLDLTLTALSSGALRVRMLERHDLPPRWEVRGLPLCASPPT